LLTEVEYAMNQLEAAAAQRRDDLAEKRRIDERQRQVEHFIGVLRPALPELRERFGVTSLELFGSYVRGEQRSDSDLDILVTFDRIPTLFELVHLADELSDLIGVNVDLVPKRGLRPGIGGRIVAEAVPV
jgi:uncharacterized protein